jgi:hypothetical protein
MPESTHPFVRRLAEFAEGVLGPKGRTIVMTVGEELREEGRLEVARALVLRLLRSRFGAVTFEVERRVIGASLEELFCWADRVVSVATLDQVFAS